MTEMTNNPGELIKQMLDNTSKWDLNLSTDDSIAILEKHSELMTQYQVLSIENLPDQDKQNLYQVFLHLKELMAKLEAEKVELFEKMTQLNQSDKIATQYIKQFSESFFIDKDF